MAEKADDKDTTPAAAADAPPAADALAPDPEAARAVFEEQLERIAQRERDEAEAKRKAAADALSADLARRLKERKAEGREQLKARAVGKDREQAAKEASVPGSDPRESVFDGAPGKSLDDILARNEERAAGYHSDVPAEKLPPQFFVVTDEADLIEVARKVGLPDHAQLGAINGRYNSVYGVQPGERVVLPAEYRFDGIDGVVTEGDEVAEEEPAEYRFDGIDGVVTEGDEVAEEEPAA